MALCKGCLFQYLAMVFYLVSYLRKAGELQQVLENVKWKCGKQDFFIFGVRPWRPIVPDCVVRLLALIMSWLVVACTLPCVSIWHPCCPWQPGSPHQDGLTWDTSWEHFCKYIGCNSVFRFFTFHGASRQVKCSSGKVVNSSHVQTAAALKL